MAHKIGPCIGLDIKEACKVTVSGLPDIMTSMELFDLFNVYFMHKIVFTHIKPGSTIGAIVFKTKRDATEATRNPPIFNGKTLVLKRSNNLVGKWDRKYIYYGRNDSNDTGYPYIGQDKFNYYYYNELRKYEDKYLKNWDETLVKYSKTNDVIWNWVLNGYSNLFDNLLDLQRNMHSIGLPSLPINYMICKPINLELLHTTMNTQ